MNLTHIRETLRSARGDDQKTLPSIGVGCCAVLPQLIQLLIRPPFADRRVGADFA